MSMSSSAETMIDASSPAERLSLSRARLLNAMQDISASRSEAAKQQAGASNVWMDSLAAMPGGTVMLEALRIWWEKHPLHIAAGLAAGAAKATLKPMANRYPLRLVFAAFVVGAIFVGSRPWRWIFKPAILMGFLPQIFTKLLTQLPSQSWSGALTTLLQQQLKSTAEARAASDIKTSRTAH
jgi:hypothetical protein